MVADRLPESLRAQLSGLYDVADQRKGGQQQAPDPGCIGQAWTLATRAAALGLAPTDAEADTDGGVCLLWRGQRTWAMMTVVPGSGTELEMRVVTRPLHRAALLQFEQLDDAALARLFILRQFERLGPAAQ